MPHIAYIGIGSNLGDRRAAISAAIDRLRLHPRITRVEVSTLHATRPVGGPAGQPEYLNAAARIETDLLPAELLALLMCIERGLGRQRQERWGPRTIDLDLLMFDEQIVDTPELTVPHPRLHERPFVLEPLCELAPDVLHPVLRLTARQLLDQLGGKSA